MQDGLVVEEALGGPELLSALRGAGFERPFIDHALATNIRRDLEDAITPWLPDLGEGVVVRVNKDRLRRVLRCERHLVATLAIPPDAPSAPVVRGALLDRLFAQVVSGFSVSNAPVADALAAATVAGDAWLLDAWEGLPSAERAEVTLSVEHAALALVSRWPTLPPTRSCAFKSRYVSRSPTNA